MNKEYFYCPEYLDFAIAIDVFLVVNYFMHAAANKMDV